MGGETCTHTHTTHDRLRTEFSGTIHKKVGLEPVTRSNTAHLFAHCCAITYNSFIMAKCQIQLTQGDVTFTRTFETRAKKITTERLIHAGTNHVCNAIRAIRKQYDGHKEATGKALKCPFKWSHACTVRVVVDDVLMLDTEELINEAGVRYTFRPQNYENLKAHCILALEWSQLWSASDIKL